MTDICCITACLLTCQKEPSCHPQAGQVPKSRPRSAGCRTSSHTTRPGPHRPRPRRRICSQVCLSRPSIHGLEPLNNLMYDCVFTATILEMSLLADGPIRRCKWGSRLWRFRGVPQVCCGQDCGRLPASICRRDSEDDVPGGRFSFGVPTVLHRWPAQRLAGLTARPTLRCSQLLPFPSCAFSHILAPFLQTYQILDHSSKHLACMP